MEEKYFAKKGKKDQNWIVRESIAMDGIICLFKLIKCRHEHACYTQFSLANEHDANSIT